MLGCIPIDIELVIRLQALSVSHHEEDVKEFGGMIGIIVSDWPVCLIETISIMQIHLPMGAHFLWS
jgi:hypothetical protein